MIDIQPKAIDKVGDEELRVIWNDGHRSVFSFQLLRRSCRCAECKDEVTGEAKLAPESIPATLKAGRAEMVGQYGLSFAFSDGHGTGIYTFEHLRGICPCGECSGYRGARG